MIRILTTFLVKNTDCHPKNVASLLLFRLGFKALTIDDIHRNSGERDTVNNSSVTSDFVGGTEL